MRAECPLALPSLVPLGERRRPATGPPGVVRAATTYAGAWPARGFVGAKARPLPTRLGGRFRQTPFHPQNKTCHSVLCCPVPLCAPRTRWLIASFRPLRPLPLRHVFCAGLFSDCTRHGSRARTCRHWWRPLFCGGTGEPRRRHILATIMTAVVFPDLHALPTTRFPRFPHLPPSLPRLRAGHLIPNS
jgi:hypothetical protein